LNNAKQFPIAAKAKFGNVRSNPDLVTSKLAALHFYQLAIPAPKPPAGSFNAQAAERGKAVFEGKANCATCHVPPLYSEPGWPMHTAKEIGSTTSRQTGHPINAIGRHRSVGFLSGRRVDFTTMAASRT
jgi:mono/diheme cytochrome c family protein